MTQATTRGLADSAHCCTSACASAHPPLLMTPMQVTAPRMYTLPHTSRLRLAAAGEEEWGSPSCDRQLARWAPASGQGAARCSAAPGWRARGRRAASADARCGGVAGWRAEAWVTTAGAEPVLCGAPRNSRLCTTRAAGHPGPGKVVPPGPTRRGPTRSVQLQALVEVGVPAGVCLPERQRRLKHLQLGRRGGQRAGSGAAAEPASRP